MKGIEPSSVAWKATALPLSYTRARRLSCRASLRLPSPFVPEAVCVPRGQFHFGMHHRHPFALPANTSFALPDRPTGPASIAPHFIASLGTLLACPKNVRYPVRMDYCIASFAIPKRANVLVLFH